MGVLRRVTFGVAFRHAPFPDRMTELAKRGDCRSCRAASSLRHDVAVGVRRDLSLWRILYLARGDGPMGKIGNIFGGLGGASENRWFTLGGRRA